MAKYKKGQSGNPGGRPKENTELKELARTYTTEAVERLAFWMRSEEPRASVAAAEKLLERGYGKAAQHHEITGKDGKDITVNINLNPSGN